jgi:hypothetical protein
MGDLFGIFPDIGNTFDFEDQTLYQQRYLRKGVYDTLPDSETAYEKLLAVCADDVLFRGYHELTYGKYSPDGVDKKYAENIIQQLREDLEFILQRRACMTQKESDQHQFEDAVSKTIHFHSDLLCKGENNTNFCRAVRLQIMLKEILAPWFSVKVYISLSGVIWQWVLAKPGEDFRKPRDVKVTLDSVPTFCQMGRIWLVDQKLEEMRARILHRVVLKGEQLQFARCFRRYLETGCESDMPLLAVGSRPTREVPFTEFFQNM